MSNDPKPLLTPLHASTIARVVEAFFMPLAESIEQREDRRSRLCHSVPQTTGLHCHNWKS
jgi:hypothetical protein